MKDRTKRQRGPAPHPPDIFSAANSLIKQYGKDATAVAASFATGDGKSKLSHETVWRDVIEAIKVLEETERPAGELLH